MKKVLASAMLVAALVVATSPSAEAKAKVSASCAAALDAGDQIITLNAEYASDVTAFFTANAAAARVAQTNLSIVGMTEFVKSLTAATGVLTDQTRDITSRVTTVGTAYRAASAKCRAGK